MSCSVVICWSLGAYWCTLHRPTVSEQYHHSQQDSLHWGSVILTMADTNCSKSILVEKLEFYQKPKKKKKSVKIVCFELISSVLGYLRKCVKCLCHKHSATFVIPSKNHGSRKVARAFSLQLTSPRWSVSTGRPRNSSMPLCELCISSHRLDKARIKSGIFLKLIVSSSLRMLLD